MVRKIAILILLIPLCLNGMWMLCDNNSSLAREDSGTSANSQGSEDCTTMCAVKKKQYTGAMCFISSGDSKASITVFVYGVAILTPSFALTQQQDAGQFIPELSAFYLNPRLPRSTPPPRA